MKTLLLNPPSAFEDKFISREQCGIGFVEKKFLPSEIFLNAAYLQEMGHEVVAVDLDQSDLDFSEYEVVVVWVCVLHTFYRDLQWLQNAKNSGCRTVMVLNDAYSDFEYHTMQQYSFIDAAVRLWERELSLDALLGAWSEGTPTDYPGLVIRNNKGTLIDTGMHPRSSDLNHLISCAPQLREQPLHRYDVAGITPGGGCTASCGFCLYAKTAQRKRAMDDVLDEVQALAERIKNIHFLDPDLPSTRS